MLKRIPWRLPLAAVILLLTIGLFINYFAEHPAIRRKLAGVDPLILLTLLLLYLAFVGSLAMVNSASLRLCGRQIKTGESLLLTMYSSIINFFGPLQSGPAFRALYLKKRHGVKLRDYTLASFVYYFFYALFSGCLLLSCVLKWWLIPVLLLTLLMLVYLKNASYARLGALRRLSLDSWYYMAMAALLQVSLLVMIFFIELNSVSPGISLSQVLAYTGAANFALFVSITPGAIGFRESFLLFSQKLHHISDASIVTANTIDRGVYLSLLLILSVFIIANHTKRRLKI